MKYFLGLVFIAVSMSQAVQGQKAQLVDELDGMNCEVLWARLDAFMAEVSRNPNAIAVVDVSGKTTDPPHVDFYWYEFIRFYFLRSQLPRERWQIRRTSRVSERRAVFWLVPPGAPVPDVEEADWSFVYPADTKPFVFTHGDNYSAQVGVCLNVDEIQLLSQALTSNPTARVDVVLIVRSERSFQRRSAQTLRLLTKDYSIPASRIRIFKKIDERPNPLGIRPDTEYWFVPERRN